MKIKKLVVFILITIVMLSNNIQNVYASQDLQLTKMKPTKVSNIFFDELENSYYDIRENGYIDKIYVVENGKITRSIEPSEYVEIQYKQDIEEAYLTKMLRSKNNIDLKYETLQNNYYSIYTELSNRQAYIYGERSSIIQKNPGPGDDTFSISYSSTKSHVINIKLDAIETSAVKLGVSYTWTNSASVSSVNSMSIPAGYQGYWRFDPLVRISTGDVTTYSGTHPIATKRVQATYPVKIGKNLDGMLVAVKQKI